MAEVIVVTSGKGGVGKTAVSANIGVSLALINKNVLLLDADIGLRNMDIVLGFEHRIVFDLVDIIRGNCSIKQAVIKDKRYRGLYFLPAAQTKDKYAVTPEEMKDLCGALKKDYDYIIIDSPTGIGQGFKNAIAGADSAIVVITPEAFAIRDADRVIGLLEQNGITNSKLIINKIRPKMVRSGDMLNIHNVADMLSVELIGIIPDDEEIIISMSKGEPAAANMKTVGGQAYRNIAQRLTGKYVPLMGLDEKKGFMRIFNKSGGKKTHL